MAAHTHAVVVPTWLALALTAAGLLSSGFSYWHTNDKQVAVDIATLKAQMSLTMQQVQTTDAKVDQLINGLLK